MVDGKKQDQRAPPLIVVKRDEAPEERGFVAGGVALADEFRRVDIEGRRRGRLKGVGRDDDGTAEEGGFAAATGGGARGAAGAEEKDGAAGHSEKELLLHRVEGTLGDGRKFRKTVMAGQGKRDGASRPRRSEIF